MTVMQPELEFRHFLAEGRFMLQRCLSSGRYVFYPRVAEPGSGATDLEWVSASGRGRVYSTTTIRPRPPATPYNVALIDLAEGPRLMSSVRGIDAEDVRIGLSVRARIISENDVPVLIFEPDA